MKNKLRHSFGPVVGTVLFVAAVGLIHHLLREYQYHEIVRHVRELPRERVYLALGLTALNFFILTGYDTLALRYIRHSLAYGKIAFASFIAYAFSQSLGFALLTGGSVRFRLYSAFGLSAVEITNIIAFSGVTLWLGFFMLGGLSFVLEPIPIPALLHLPFFSLRPLGVILLALVAGYLAWGMLLKRPLRIRSWEFPVPSSSLLLFQIALPSVDWLVAGTVLWVLFPQAHGLTFPGFLAIFLLAQIAGLLSHIPGGLGVFETIMILFLSPTLSAAQVLGIILAYRGIYYLLPLLVASVVLGAYEFLLNKARVRGLARMVGQWVPTVVPQLLALTTFLGGAILLFSGATPAVRSRMAWINDLLPLPIVEISHFLGSVAGVGLLILARGLQRRLDAAYHLSVLLPKVGHGFAVQRNWMPQFKDSFHRLVAQPEAEQAPAVPGFGDLPLVELPAQKDSADYLAVILTGDGGWASLDREVGNYLAGQGVPVVGFNTLQYFWNRKTPEQAAQDLERVLSHYLAAWDKPAAVLIGYSLGADVLPFMANRLPRERLDRIKLIVLLGPELSVDFEFHLSNWIGGSSPNDRPVLPEVEKLKGSNLLCLYGQEETDSLCQKLPAGLAKVVELQGAHHFGGDYQAIAEMILKEINSSEK